MKKKVALYLRVSTDDQDTESQVENLERYCRMRDWQIVKRFVDTGSRDDTGRTDYQNLIKFAYQGKCDVVLVWEISRFGSSMREAVNHYSEFKDRGIEFASFSEQIDTTGPYGELFFALITGLANIELNNIRARVKRGMDYAAKHGTKSGRPIGKQPLPKDDIRTAIRLIDENESLDEDERLTVKQIMTNSGISKSSYYRVLHAWNELTTDGQGENATHREKIKKAYHISDRMFTQIFKAYQSYYPERY